MYLSRMELHPRRRGARELLSSPGKMHGAVMDAFPRDLINEKRVLWRVDTLSDRSLLYIVSPDKPSFEHIQEQAGWANEQSWAIRDYTPLLQGIMRGQTYAFRLTANPTHTVTLENGQKKRLAHVTVKQQTQWLVDPPPTRVLQRSRKHGLSISRGGGLAEPTCAVGCRP